MSSDPPAIPEIDQTAPITVQVGLSPLLSLSSTITLTLSKHIHQIEQHEQLNIFLLQDIDKNFSDFHQIITTRLIPAVKRFNQVGEPTREYAKVSIARLDIFCCVHGWLAWRDSSESGRFYQKFDGDHLCPHK